jgi:hypothetical protein
MILPPDIRVFGNPDFRGNCPTENADQVTLFAAIRRQWPKTWGRLAFHPRNEGKRTIGQAMWQKAEGLTEGTVDLIIPTARPLVMELKRRDHTKSKWQPGQEDYLRSAQDAGAWVCLALGWEAAWEAVKAWDAETK